MPNTIGLALGSLALALPHALGAEGAEQQGVLLRAVRTSKCAVFPTVAAALTEGSAAGRSDDRRGTSGTYDYDEDDEDDYEYIDYTYEDDGLEGTGSDSSVAEKPARSRGSHRGARRGVRSLVEESVCTDLRAYFEYLPYRSDELGERLADHLVLPLRRQVRVELWRPATVYLCLAHLTHSEEDAATMDLESDFPGFSFASELASATRNSRGRTSSKGGLEDCGLTFVKEADAGELHFNDMPARSRVYLSEGKGAGPTPLPQVSEGREVPAPNTLCPAWVLEEDLMRDYRDGRSYHTWHAQWHPTYWCAYGHEHGSDPSVFGPVTYPDGRVSSTLEVPFGFVEHSHERGEAAEAGFKGYAVQGEDLNMYFVVNSLTSSLERVCRRFNTVMAYGLDRETGELMFEMGYKADFGPARNSNDFISDDTCGDQAQVFPECKMWCNCNWRQFRTLDKAGWEVWRGGDNYVNLDNPPFSALANKLQPLPLELSNFKVELRNPVTGCVDQTCSTSYATGLSGSQRAIAFGSLTVRYEAGYDSDGDGYFSTDAHGFFLRDVNLVACRKEQGGTCQLPEGELLQYVKPGFRAREVGTRFYPSDPYTMQYTKRAGMKGYSVGARGGALKLGVTRNDCLCKDGARFECACYVN